MDAFLPQPLYLTYLFSRPFWFLRNFAPIQVLRENAQKFVRVKISTNKNFAPIQVLRENAQKFVRVKISTNKVKHPYDTVYIERVGFVENWRHKNINLEISITTGTPPRPLQKHVQMTLH